MAMRLGESDMKRAAARETVPGTAPLSDQSGEVQSLGNAELRYRRLFESARDGIMILDAGTGSISDVNPRLIEMLGYSRDDYVNRTFRELDAFRDGETGSTLFRELRNNEFILYENLPLTTKDGRPIQVEFVSNAYEVGGEQVIQATFRDIGERQRTDAALQAKEEARLSLMENLEEHWRLIENLPVGVVVHDPETRIVLSNSEASKLLGMSSVQLLGKEARDPDWHFMREDGSRLPLEEFPVNRVIATGSALRNFVMGIAPSADGAPTWVLVNAYPEFGDNLKLRQVEVTLADISDIKRAGESIRRHLEHLTALIEIGRAINFSFDLDLSLTTLLTHVIVQLGVDAADVLMFNPASRTLDYVVGRGFHTRTVEQARLSLGEGYAGHAARERSIVHVPDLAKTHDSFLRKLLAAGENFVSYHGAPLIAKGQVVGVLEVFHRTGLERDDEWRDFLKALAAQAALAIDNVSLFDNLQRSNRELAQAYDATIEGWSRALELRDNETEGHSQRVADLTVRLARLFGMGDEELVQVRWGALLHDIGKMGIPDAILLKQDALSEEEWVVMKKHTVFAYEMLSPIRYLRAALDIPYAHHEKWDGSGYPLGLKGEQIPLVARIFAVVDVWDALRSDRLYRSSWSVAKVRKHLRSLAGTHFDPHVVKVCLASNVLVE